MAKLSSWGSVSHLLCERELAVQRGRVSAGLFSPLLVFLPCFRKLRATLDEYTTRVGQQAIVLCISPSKPNPVFKVFGAAPLENVVGVPGEGRKELPHLFCRFCPAQGSLGGLVGI